MPTFRVPDLHPLGVAILRSAGASPEESTVVADHCMAAQLSGDANHGLVQVVWYVDHIDKGVIRPGLAPTTVRETATTILVDGHFNLGHYVSHRTMQRLIDKGREHHVAAASVKNQGHVGRLIDYTAMAAREGFIALMMCDGAWTRKRVAPLGGKQARLGVNPWSMALPSSRPGGVVGFDMTSGAMSGAKLWRAQAEGRDVPLGWVLDADGHPTEDAFAIERGGTMMPMGGIGGSHKGYVLSFMIEALADVLCGMEFREDLSKGDVIIDGAFMAVFDVDAFRPLAEWNRDLDGLIDYVKSSAPVDPTVEILYPGERSQRETERRIADGVDIPDDMWTRIVECATSRGLADLVPSPIR